MAFYGDGDFLVLEKRTGLVRNAVDGVLQAGAALDLAVDGAGERGLLGIAVHPDFPQRPHVYLFYTPSSTGSDTVGVTPLPCRVERYNFANGTLSNPLTILTIAAPDAIEIHVGGTMAFGPDGKLYVIVGDRSQNGGLQNNGALQVANDTSVILRVDDDGDAPGDNPLSAAGIDVSKYYAYGIRNSFGIAFDPQTGDLWQTENGPESYDELNRVVPGFNSGWNVLMGPDSRDPDSAAQLTAITGGQYSDPEFSWQEIIAPTGLAFLRGSALGAAYDDSLIVAGFSGDRTLFRFALNGARTAIVSPHASLNDLVADNGDDLSGLDFGSDFGGVSDLKVGPDGFLYGVSLTLGEVFVIRPVGAGEAVHDLALVKLAAPKRAKISAKRPVVETKAKLQIQNRSPQDETIVDLATLEALVALDVEPVGDGECGSPEIELVPPKRFPITLKPKKKLSLKYRVSFDCADSYAFTATVSHEPIDDLADTHPADDFCPRPPLPFGVDPNPDGKLKDKGCGAKVSGGDRGGAVVTEVIQK